MHRPGNLLHISYTGMESWKDRPLCERENRCHEPTVRAPGGTPKGTRGMSETTENIVHYTEANRRAWNEIAQVRHAKQPPAAFFAGGNSTLDAREVQADGELRGHRLLHLQCAIGEDLFPHKISPILGITTLISVISVINRWLVQPNASVSSVHYSRRYNKRSLERRDTRQSFGFSRQRN